MSEDMDCGPTQTEKPPFDPEDWTTWPIPNHGVNTRRKDGRPWRLSEYGDGWATGFEEALELADHFHKTGEWKVRA